MARDSEIILSRETIGLNEDEVATIGKLSTPLRMVIKHESELGTNVEGARKWLFKTMTSNSFADTFMGQNEFPIFKYAPEGGDVEAVTINETYKKVITNMQFMQEFQITKMMMEDAHYGVSAEMKDRAASFTRSYYRTVHQACANALVNGHNKTMNFAGTSIDLTTGDGEALFSSNHKWGKNKSGMAYGTQSNFFKHGGAFASAEAFEETLAELAIKIRNMKDENGFALGYTADTIVLPGNTPVIERLAKKVCGTDQPMGGTNAAYINTQYGGWKVYALPEWQVDGDAKEMLVMSSTANDNLSGNLFLNRVGLEVSDFVDIHTRNYIWNGRCRFGVGFGTYKHILKLTTDTENSSATTL
jgi:hypothetical protein